MGDPALRRYAVKYEGKPFAAKTYHLYDDCPYLQSLMAVVDLTPRLMSPDDSIVALLEMRVCAGCEARSTEVPIETIIINTTGCTEHQAEQLLVALGANDFVVKRIKRRTTQSAVTDPDT